MEHEPEYKHAGYLGNLIPPKALKLTVAKAVAALDRLKTEYDTIAVRGTSGLLIGPVLCAATGKELIIVRKSGDGAHSPQTTEGNAATKRYLIADDVIDTGNTAREIIKAMRRFAPKAECVGILEVNRMYMELLHEYVLKTPEYVCKSYPELLADPLAEDIKQFLEVKTAE